MRRAIPTTATRDEAIPTSKGQSGVCRPFDEFRSGEDLCSQPTSSRLENLPGPVAPKRTMAAMVALFCDSVDRVPRRLVLDIDDTEDRVFGWQQLSLFGAHHDNRCYMPILTVREAMPRTQALVTAAFTTLRLRLLKLGARVIETASRVRIAFAVACPDAGLVCHLASVLQPAGP